MLIKTNVYRSHFVYAVPMIFMLAGRFIHAGNILVVLKSLNITAFVCFIKTIKEFLPSMLQQNRGHIVSIASIAGCTGLPGAVDYCSSKFAAVGLMEALRQELASQGKTGIQFTTVCPSLITTGMFEGVKFR